MFCVYRLLVTATEKMFCCFPIIWKSHVVKWRHNFIIQINYNIRAVNYMYVTVKHEIIWLYNWVKRSEALQVVKVKLLSMMLVLNMMVLLCWLHDLYIVNTTNPFITNCYYYYNYILYFTISYIAVEWSLLTFKLLFK